MEAKEGLLSRARRAAEEHHGRPATVECRGCGRPIPIDGLELWQKFICRNCMRTMRLTAPLFHFRFTRGVAIRKRVYTAIFAALLVAASTAWGWRQDQTVPGHAGVVYPMTTGVAVVVAIGVVVAREFTQEYRLIGGFMLLALGARRLAMWAFEREWGHPHAERVLIPSFFALGFGFYFLWLVRRRRRVLPIR